MMDPSLRVYIGASSVPTEIARVKRLTCFLSEIKNNVTVTSTWWKHVEDVGVANSPDMSYADQFAYSHRDLTEVDCANWLWVLMPPPGNVSAGAFFEFGYSYALHKHIVVSGPGQAASIFTSKADLQFETDEDALSFFRKIA